MSANPIIFTCENSKYLESIIDGSVITYDTIKDAAQL